LIDLVTLLHRRGGYVESEQRFHEFRIGSSVGGGGLIDGRSPLGSEQLEETGFTRGQVSGEIRLNLSVFDGERLTQHLNCFIVKTHRSQDVRELISQRRKLSELPRVARRAFGVERALQAQECVRQC